jgi:hypothetical protein
MAKGLPRSLSRGDPAKQEIIRQVFTLDAVPVTVDGATGVGDAQHVIGGLPEGNILFLGAVSYMQFAGPGSDAGLVDTWAGDYSIGSTPDSDDDLTGGDVDMVVKTALAAATAEVSPRTRGTSTTAEAGRILDNTAGNLEINLNLLVDDLDISADGIPFTITGDLHITYIMLGDD